MKSKDEQIEDVPSGVESVSERIKNLNKHRAELERSRKLKEKENKRKTWWRYLLNVALAVVIVIVVIVGGYIAYLQVGYSRIPDFQALAVEGNCPDYVQKDGTYSIITYNIGFGAYSPEFSFFMDEGKMKDGTKTVGKSSRAESASKVTENTKGAIGVVTSSLYSNTDFYFFQEVDSEGDRSQKVNQVDMLKNSFKDYGKIFASNFHSSFLFYPVFNPIGKASSGIMTMSKYYAMYATRRSLPIEQGFFNKFFDLDRCITVTKLHINNISNRFLTLINVHLSAYDDGSIREEQLKMLYDLLEYEYKTLNNFVVVGGDFNHVIAGNNGFFQNNMETPEWCLALPKNYDADAFAKIGYTVCYDSSAIATKLGTCRDSSVAYQKGNSFEAVIDGFMVSNNIIVNSTKTIDTSYLYSDHNPVYMNFTLLG